MALVSVNENSVSRYPQGVYGKPPIDRKQSIWKSTNNLRFLMFAEDEMDSTGDSKKTH
jgi:hypothetical protein